MKKFVNLIFTILFLCLVLPLAAEEKINNFDVRFELNKDASATVKEYITVTAEHNQIKRGIFRKIPLDNNKHIFMQSLYMDGETHPYEIVHEDNAVNISFGTDDFIPVGEHTYVLTYNLYNLPDTNIFRDFLFWNVTGGAWTLPIEKATFTLTVPHEVKPITKKIVSYINDEKLHNANKIAENIFTFQTPKPLKEGEVFSIYFPMRKGVFKFKWYEVQYMPVIICTFILLYYFIIWYLIGRDPTENKLPYRIKPPQDISAGFVSYFLNGPFSPKNLATVFASLMVKKKIKLTFSKWKLGECEKISDAYSDLEEDEARLMMCLPPEFKFDNEGYLYLRKGLKSITHYYESKIDDYVINNFVYMIFPIIFFIAMLFYFHFRGVLPYMLYSLVLNFLIPIIIGVYMKSIRRIIFVVIIFLMGSGFGIISALSVKALLNPNVIAILITTFATALFVHLINNLMYEGAVLRDELAAFKKYMTIAERDRVAFSNPAVAGRVFCDYLPYAYAFGMESEWFSKFEHKINVRLRDEYEPLMSSKLLNVGLLFTIITAMNSKEMTGGSGIGPRGFGKGPFIGGGGR